MGDFPAEIDDSGTQKTRNRICGLSAERNTKRGGEPANGTGIPLGRR